MRVKAPAGAALVWLGASTLAWTLALAVELALRVPSAGSTGSLLYAPSLALLASLRWSLAVALVHLAVRALRARGAWAVVVPWSALGVVAMQPAYRLSGDLVSGDWISEQSYAPTLRWVLCTALVVDWMLVWLWHAWGTEPVVRGAWPFATRAKARLAANIIFWLLGALSLPVLFVVLGGPLRPYAALAEQLLFPTWLVAATLAFRCLRARPRAGAIAAALALVLATCALPLRALDTRGVARLRAQAIGATVWLAGSEGLLRTRPPARRTHLDFADAERGPCPKARRLPALPLPAPQRRNVILLSIDTVRRDVIGQRYGERAVAPNLEAFARESIAFDRATSPAPITLYALGSLLTGHSVSQLLWLASTPKTIFVRTRRIFDRQFIVLPRWSVLQRRRFTALAIQRTPVIYLSRKIDPSERFLTELEHARTAGQRVFAWLHLVDPHHPYAKHREFDFGPEPMQRYHGEVAYADAILGRVLSRLRETGWFDDSLIAIFSDHGEIVGEGGYFGHGISMVGRLTDVPLYVRAPGVTPRHSAAPVTLTDLAPTILHYLDAPVPETFAGTSLLSPELELARRPWPASTSYGVGTSDFDHALDAPMRTRSDLVRRQAEIARWARLPPELAVTSTGHRYLLDMKTGSERLYDRARDPLERHDILPDAPDLVRRFRARAAEWRRDEAHRLVCMLRAKNQGGRVRTPTSSTR